MSFVHTHVHSQYSLLDGAILVPELCSYVKSLGQTAVAISDHGFLGAAVELYKEAKKAGIKPIFAVEAYITDDPDGAEEKHRDNHHLLLIAKTNEGYRRLLQLTSHASLSNFYYKPRIYKHHLQGLAGHVICTTACLGGPIASRCTFEKDDTGRVIKCHDPSGQALAEIEFYRNIFGDDLYLELQDWTNWEEIQPCYNEFLLEVGRQRQMKFVLTADAHFLRKEDHELHELLMALQLKKTVEEYRANSDMLYGAHFYIRSSEDMLGAAKRWKCEEAYYNTQSIADQCNVTLELGVYKPPSFNVRDARDYSEYLIWKEQHYGKPSELECFRQSR